MITYRLQQGRFSRRHGEQAHVVDGPRGAHRGHGQMRLIGQVQPVGGWRSIRQISKCRTASILIVLGVSARPTESRSRRPEKKVSSRGSHWSIRARRALSAALRVIGAAERSTPAIARLPAAQLNQMSGSCVVAGAGSAPDRRGRFWFVAALVLVDHLAIGDDNDAMSLGLDQHLAMEVLGRYRVVVVLLAHR